MCQRMVISDRLISDLGKNYTGKRDQILRDLFEGYGEDNCLLCEKNETCEDNRKGYGQKQLEKGILPINN